MKKLRRDICLVAGSLYIFAACNHNEPLQPVAENAGASDPAPLFKASTNTGGLEEAVPSSLLSSLNKKLKAERKNYIVALVEYITDGAGAQMGKTLYYKDIGNKQLSHHWVPGDPNRDGRTNITWTIDQTELCADIDEEVRCINAINRAMTTWNGVACATIPLVKLNGAGIDWGYVQFLLGFGGVEGWAADFTHAGWQPAKFFDAIADGGSTYILGATFTFIWIDNSTGNPTDMDNNNKADVAFREVYYNDAFTWKINGHYDVETIALHESGHGVSLAHFGKAFGTTANNKLHFSPMAVMNAAYTGIHHELLPTDVASFCSVWSHWPNR